METAGTRSLRLQSQNLDRGCYDERPLDGAQLDSLFHGIYPANYPEESIHLKTSYGQFARLRDAFEKSEDQLAKTITAFMEIWARDPKTKRPTIKEERIMSGHCMSPIQSSHCIIKPGTTADVLRPYELKPTRTAIILRFYETRRPS